MGLDWDKIRKDYEAKATPEELQVADWEGKQLKQQSPQGSKRAPRAKTPSERNYWRGERQKKYDVEAIVAAYKRGLSCKQVAKEFSCSEATVRNYVKSAGVYDPKRDKGGSKPKEVCSRGHIYAEVGFFATKKGGKDCKACARIRGTNAKRRKRELQRQALERSGGSDVQEVRSA